MIASVGCPLSDSVTQRIRASAENSRDCGQMSYTALTEVVRSDGIDILLDLAGHTVGKGQTA